MFLVPRYDVGGVSGFLASPCLCCFCAPWQPHHPLSKTCPRDVSQPFPGTHTALPWKVSVAKVGTALLPCHTCRGALCYAWSISQAGRQGLPPLGAHVKVSGSLFSLPGPRGLQQGPAPAPCRSLERQTGMFPREDDGW